MLATADDRVRVRPPEVSPRESRGRRDALVQPPVALSEALPLAGVAAWGVATGTAAAMREGVNVGTRTEVKDPRAGHTRALAGDSRCRKCQASDTQGTGRRGTSRFCAWVLQKVPGLRKVPGTETRCRQRCAAGHKRGPLLLDPMLVTWSPPAAALHDGGDLLLEDSRDH